MRKQVLALVLGFMTMASFAQKKELKTAENKNVYSNDIEYDDDIDYSKAPKRTRESTSSDY